MRDDRADQLGKSGMAKFNPAGCKGSVGYKKNGAEAWRRQRRHKTGPTRE